MPIDKAIDHKNKGNEAFAKQNWAEAMTNYHYGLLAIRHLTMSSGGGNAANPMLGMVGGTGPKSTPEEAAEAATLQNTILLNMGAVFLKQHKPQRAVDELSKVITRDKNAVKAYYRRGQAHLELKNFDSAKSDFLKFKELSPTEDKVIEANLRKIAQWEKQQEAKAAKVYQNMFAGADDK